MLVKSLNILRRYSFVVFTFVTVLILHFYRLSASSSFFGDQAWYYFAARDALFSGRFPLWGIASSITWLHQGPLWTYFLIPALGLFRFHPLAPVIFISVFNLAAFPLAYLLGSKLKSRACGLVYAVVLCTFYFSVFHSRLAYHTSPIPVLFLVCLLCLRTRRTLLAGLFLGFLYQSHLLTFIYWPLVLYFLLRDSAIKPLLLFGGFCLGILPLVLSGPVQVLGIFPWLIYKLLSGFSGTGLISEAYLTVIVPPFLLLVSYLVSRLPGRLTYILLVLFILINGSYLLAADYLISTHRYGLPYPQKVRIAGKILAGSYSSAPAVSITGPGQEFASSPLPYTYLVWWLSSEGFSPSGVNRSFSVNDETGLVTVIK